MKITSLRIKGFRSLRDVTWQPGNLNVLIGPNGSGKTNLLRALALLKQAAVGGLEQAILRSGGLAQICWDGELKEGIRCYIDSEEPDFIPEAEAPRRPRTNSSSRRIFLATSPDFQSNTSSSRTTRG